MLTDSLLLGQRTNTMQNVQRGLGNSENFTAA
jgi:hypothetical protein